jgi:glycosyltransferase involved in cell wall biosynthesis
VSREGRTRSVIVVGSGTRFLSGISVYTMRLANALADSNRVSVITMRRLLPARLYPGRGRVGADLARFDHRPDVDVLDGVDWYWLPSMLRAGWFLVRRRPDVVIFEWWTGTVLHSYLGLALLSRLVGARVVVEFHEIIETGEAQIRFVPTYVRAMLPLLLGLANGLTVHSEFDRRLVRETYHTGRRPIVILPHGPHDHYQGSDAIVPTREAPPGVINLLFFGVIRPYKGLEDLIAAFEALPEEAIGNYWLTVVGETWEGWVLPAELIGRSPRRDRITFVNRYVSDEELHGYLLGADVVVLPYLRSSLSGPLHVAMGYGLPIIMTNVGGNPEAAEGYAGIVLVPPSDPPALAEALLSVGNLMGQEYAHPQSWANTATAYAAVFDRLLEP